jgi:2-polyprenyl-3-methyl-5-hydroxy-6-metoxy-1,4-benzoquinol methylase
MNEKQKENRISSSDWLKNTCEVLDSCPMCSSASRELLYDDLEDYAFRCAPGKWVMYQCASCGIAYLDPRLNQESIGLAYKQYYTHQKAAPNKSRLDNLKLAMINGYRNIRFGVEFSPSNRLWVLYYLFPRRRRTIDSEGRGLEKIHDDRAPKVLDVGCGNGVFLVFAKMLGWQAFGVEPDPLAAKTASELEVEVLAKFIDDVPDKYNESFDAITLSHVIEHVHDPVAMIQKCHHLLVEGGRLWMETPNINSQGHQRYGKYWRGLEAPRHLMIFNWRSLKALLKKAGFIQISREIVHYSSKWMFKESLAQLERDSRKASFIEKMKLLGAVYWADFRTRSDLSRREFITVSCIKPVER